MRGLPVTALLRHFLTEVMKWTRNCLVDRVQLEDFFPKLFIFYSILSQAKQKKRQTPQQRIKLFEDYQTCIAFISPAKLM